MRAVEYWGPIKKNRPNKNKIFSRWKGIDFRIKKRSKTGIDGQ
jgi:hypothetical protein